jgi:site-specific DNA recombinase
MGTFAGYVRVSRVGDRAETLISPQLQEREIRSWANARGFELEMLPAELDQSGADDSRPILQGAIERIERAELDGVIVWNFARFTRSLASSIAFLESIEQAGGQLHSTSEQIDASTPAGRMTRNFLFSIAQAERETKAEGFDKAKADAIERGIWTAPIVPFGYRKNEERRLEPDPVEGPIRAEVIQRRSGGESWHSLANYIREQTGRSFLPASVRQMVRSRTALGEASQGKHVNPNAHEPLVDRATWEAAQVAQPKPARGIHGEALLGGLIRCAGCSRRVSSTFRNGRRYYSCRRYHAGGDCPEPASISAPLIEPYVVEALFEHAHELAYSSSERTAALEGAERRLEEAEAELALYQETVRLSEVGATHFEAGMRSRVEEVEDARRALATQRLALPRVLPGTLDELWPTLSVAERRQVLRSAFSVIWIRRGRAPVPERVRLIADGFEPPDLSVQGRPAGPPLTLAWPEGDLEGEVRVAGAKDRR